MKIFKIEIKWAVIFSIFSLTWIALEKFFGLHDKHIENQMMISYFFAIPSLLVYLVALHEKKLVFYNNQMSWQQGMVCGVYLSFFIALLGVLVQVICFEWITPHFFKNMINYMTATKNMTQKNAADYFNLMSYIKQGIFGSLSMGVVTSAIVAYFVQSKKLK